MLARTSMSNAMVRSASRWRSCTSSSTTAPTPTSSGSCWIRRSSRPVVTTSTRVRRLMRRSPRTEYPTVSPTGSPSRCASRRAAARAAMRLGCVTTTRPATTSATAGGTKVVLPVPGGAWSTATPRVRIASTRGARPAATGRSGGAASRLRSGSDTRAVCLTCIGWPRRSLRSQPSVRPDRESTQWCPLGVVSSRRGGRDPQAGPPAGCRRAALPAVAAGEEAGSVRGSVQPSQD